jgi:hypothetical protein
MSRSELLRLSLEVPRAEVVTWGIQTFGGIALSPMPQRRHQSGVSVHSQRRYYRVQTIAAMFMEPLVVGRGNVDISGRKTKVERYAD